MVHEGDTAPVEVQKSSELILSGLGNVNMSNDAQDTQKKYKKMRKIPHYLTGTANSRAKTVPKSPINN